MRVRDLFEEWNNDPIEDKEVISKLNKKWAALEQEVRYWQEKLREEPMESGQDAFIKHEKQMRYIKQLETRRDDVAKQVRNAKVSFKHFRHDPEMSLRYAKAVRQGAFPEGEDAIASDGQTAINYALHVINKRFPQGEAAMKAHPGVAPEDKNQYMRLYAKYGADIRRDGEDT